MPKITTIDDKVVDVPCIACAIHSGLIKNIGGSVAQTNNFEVSQDTEIPIPGFMILSSKKHLKGIEDFSKDMRHEYIDFLYNIRKGISEVLKVEYVYLVQEEDSIGKASHFHLWIFPRYDWMDKFGTGTKSARPIMEYARESMKTESNLKDVAEAVQKLKDYLSK